MFFQSARLAWCIVITLYLIAICLRVSATQSQANCQVSESKSRGDAITRLKNEVLTVNRLTGDLAGKGHTPRQIKSLAADGLCSERIQNSDRQYLADNAILPPKQGRHGRNQNGKQETSQQVLRKIQPMIDEIMQHFQEIMAQPTSAVANAKVQIIDQIRAKAKILNHQLMVNAGLQE